MRRVALVEEARAVEVKILNTFRTLYDKANEEV
jgi:hypothetical protein